MWHDWEMQSASSLLFVVFLLTAPSASSGQTEPLRTKPSFCTTVHARYGIYASHDLLWIPGSKHLIEITDDKLDAELEKRGWEDTFAYGTFTICSEKPIPPLQMTIRDRVELKNYHQISFRSR